MWISALRRPHIDPQGDACKEIHSRREFEPSEADGSPQDKSVKVLQCKLALLVFGGKDPETGLVLSSAFEFGFGREECLNS